MSIGGLLSGFGKVLNPVNWGKIIKAALVAKYAGKPVRHGLTWISGLLLGLHLGSPEHISEVQRTLTEWLTSEEFWSGVLGVAGIFGSAAEGVKSSKETKELKEAVAEATGTGFV